MGKKWLYFPLFFFHLGPRSLLCPHHLFFFTAVSISPAEFFITHLFWVCFWSSVWLETREPALKASNGEKKEAFLTRRCIAFVHDANPYVCCEGSRTRSGASSWLHGRIPVPGVYPVTLWAWHFTNEKTLEDRSYVTLYLQSNASFLSSVTWQSLSCS